MFLRSHTHTLQQKFQPQEPALTLCKNEQSTQHNNWSCAHVQPFPPTSTCASTLTKSTIYDASSIRIPTSGSTVGQVPTTLISNDKSLLK